MRKQIIAMVSFLLLLQAMPAQAAVVTADAGATNCNQTVDNATSVLAYRISSGFCVVEFRRTGTTTWTIPTGVTSVSYLVVAGGGGGAGGQASEHGGGGGGAGGLLSGTLSVSPGSVAIAVGGGGTGGGANASGTGGSDSSLAGTVIAKGGGAGGGYYSAGPTSGGSGGGSGSSDSSAKRTGANGTAGQGSKGGDLTEAGTNGRHGAGGGGAGGAGGNTVSSAGLTVTAGAGGAGLLSTITGSDRYFGGGGGGGGSSWRGGGATGGANGGTGGGGAGASFDGSSLTSAAASGSTNTGGGGGGGIGTGGSSASVGGAGGSGIVIIRYALAPEISAAPVITGSTSYGETLTASNGSWANSPTTYSYQWSRASSSGGTYTNIAGATSSSYRLVTADVDQFIKVTVTASNTGGSAPSSSSATSMITRTLVSASISIQAGPLIFRQPKTLTSTSTVEGKITFKANGKNLPGCISRRVSSANSFTVTCTYKPSTHGHVVLTTTIVTVDASYTGATTSSGPLLVTTRTGNR